MSLGPTMHANGRSIGPGLYNVFYRWVPGFDGLRVPSLNFMLVAFFLSVLAGLGAAPLVSRERGAGRLLVALGMIAIMAESWSVPTEANAPIGAVGYRPPPTEIAGPRELSPIYVSIRDADPGTVVAEFPFGDVAYEIQYTFYAGYHRKPIVNGYSGFFPESYKRLLGLLSHTPARPRGLERAHFLGRHARHRPRRRVPGPGGARGLGVAASLRRSRDRRLLYGSLVQIALRPRWTGRCSGFRFVVM